MAFMDLEKAYDRIDRNALRQILRIYGRGGKIVYQSVLYWSQELGSIGEGKEK